ncbi:lipoprotein-releasing ABC transporter permease subunit [Candidatus Liberibacter africanus]|uniref:Lipoprotein releasing system, transmembrane protein, LolC/E family n=1 Tax=Candidatus Liberibacter africanus PTSAPSY TaxID=1277257 RepID=A0A0G3I7R5_LIBAF|nr:lipoprotein-releasing ABC transporter permease subunit [Candidatus Liberibacter africanus]AKK19772.1 lipoprotein releasing system, transmembrane protein, LolC/E family [Candidatus Liberibacter africanus PTSAPSY]QTP63645.1 lipoprotein-releasing ABC transporter permease subunit [Candidatus Liberibacter africanus]
MRIFSKFEVIVAWRYLFSSHKDAFISIASFISFFGIMIGVMVLIVVMSVMNGLRADMIKRVLGINGHIIIQQRHYPLVHYKAISNKLISISDVTRVAPFVSGQAFVSSLSSVGSGVMVRGISKNDFSQLKKSFKGFHGNISNGFDQGEIVIGQDLARNLGVAIGDKVQLLVPTMPGMAIRSKFYTIAAIFNMRFPEYDNGVIYMSLRESQLYFNFENAVSGIEVFVKDPDSIEKTHKNIFDILGNSVSIVDWRQRYQMFFSAMEVESNVMFVILALIVLVASLNIISSLIMLVQERRRDIAILRTMGAQNFSIMSIFLMIGSFIGVSGTGAGMIFGVLISRNVEAVRHFFLHTFGIVVFDIDAYLLTELPSKISWIEVSWIMIMSLSLSLFATIIPSWKASRIDPIKVLRYE